MKPAVFVIVAVGLALALLLGIERGFDTRSVITFVFIALTGALGIAAVRRSETGTIGPAQCGECGGVISPNAPFCKHCGARRASGTA